MVSSSIRGALGLAGTVRFWTRSNEGTYVGFERILSSKFWLFKIGECSVHGSCGPFPSRRLTEGGAGIQDPAKECVGIREALLDDLQDLAKGCACDLLAFGFLALALRPWVS
jgi:hypothetical protein